MKKYLLWSFERGSRPYDVIVIVILAFIFLTPHWAFQDRRACVDNNMPTGSICQTNDASGRPVWVVKVKTEQDAIDRLKASLGETVTIARTEPVYDAAWRLVAYSISIQR
jgi:hypothetical protein